MKSKNSTERVIDENSQISNVTIMGRFRGYFLAGILVTAPIAITVYLTYIFLTVVDRQVAKILPHAWYSALDDGTTIPGIGLVSAILFFVLVGWFATNFFGRIFIRMSEYVFHRVPLIGKLYAGLKQIFETIMATQSQAFREVVMLEYPRKGVWSIGFVTGKTEGEPQKLTKQETINVFVPTTPNPTSGYLLFVPKKDLHYLHMSVEDGVKLVVSAGIIAPPEKKPAAKKAPPKKVIPKKVVRKK